MSKVKSKAKPKLNQEEAALLKAAAELGEQFRSRSDEIEAARRLPPDVSAQMAEAGIYRMGAPAALGGLETAPAISSQVVETLARSDASCGWVAFIGATSFTSLAGLPMSVGREVLANPNNLITGVFAPTARAEKTEGGFRISGRWQWGSGSQNADWLLGGAVLQENGEPLLDERGQPISHMAVMPVADVEFLDTWHVSGLCGTGSLDYQVQDLFVPDERLVGYTSHDRPPTTPLYAFPNFTLLALGIAAVCLGVARAALDELVQLAASKKRVGARKTVAEQQVAQMQLARSEADLQSARLFYYQVLDDAWQTAITGSRVSVEQRRDLRLATTNAVAKSVQVVEAMYSLGGGSSVYRSSRLQRHFRDINVAKTHIMVSEQTLEVIGAHYFGLSPNVSRL